MCGKRKDPKGNAEYFELDLLRESQVLGLIMHPIHLDWQQPWAALIYEREFLRHCYYH